MKAARHREAGNPLSPSGPDSSFGVGKMVGDAQPTKDLLNDKGGFLTAWAWVWRRSIALPITDERTMPGDS